MKRQTVNDMNTNGKKKLEKNGNENKVPHWTDFKNPKRLTKDQKELIEAFREAMKALKEFEAKHGKITYLGTVGLSGLRRLH